MLSNCNNFRAYHFQQNNNKIIIIIIKIIIIKLLKIILIIIIRYMHRNDSDQSVQSDKSSLITQRRIVFITHMRKCRLIRLLRFTSVSESSLCMYLVLSEMMSLPALSLSLSLTYTHTYTQTYIHTTWKLEVRS